MNEQSKLKECISAVIKSCSFAVLATEGNGQPHTSLIAIAPFGNSGQIIFATYRNTRKYQNLTKNNKIAVLIEGSCRNIMGIDESVVLTVIGFTEDIHSTEYLTPYQALLNLHPEMESFMLSPDCVLIRVIAQSYQIVYGITDQSWITADELDKS
jgi:uncharacterized pyridoxamine 5'-phosphate oxidase family protein